ncbi:MAG: hypothetical protein AAGF01_28300 [Cyanobacteria bacterium P01_G01_bin.38]
MSKKVARMVPMGGLFAYGTQLLIAQNAVAHTNHDHTKDVESSGDVESSVPAAASDKVEIEHTTPSSAEVQKHVSEGAAIQEVPVTEMSLPTPVSRVRLSDGVSIGLGEVLLGLIIAGPFLLISLRKRLQS